MLIIAETEGGYMETVLASSFFCKSKTYKNKFP